jgi:hypothetical protein
MLAFTDFSQPFEIHTDASALQLGSVVAQNNKSIAFFSQKLNPAQTRDATTERDLLAIVETVIRLYTDHKNLTFPKTVDHIFQCTAHPRRTAILEWFSSFSVYFWSMKTSRSLIAALQSGAMAWIEQREPPAAESLVLPEPARGIDLEGLRGADFPGLERPFSWLLVIFVATCAGGTISYVQES